MAYGDRNYLSEKVLELLKEEKCGTLLDVGCGDGFLTKTTKDWGFEVTACDLDEQRFKYHSEIKFKKADLKKRLPFENESFDYITFLEVIEHLEAPYFAVSELNRVLSKRGILFLSTPNILNLKSRMRFLTEGAFEFFREPTLEQARMRFLTEGAFEFFREPTLEQGKNPKNSVLAVHIIAYRFHELEYLLFKNGFQIEGIFADLYLPTAKALSFLKPLIKMQQYIKRKRSLKKGDINYRRIHALLLSDELLYGRHLILKARKIKNK